MMLSLTQINKSESECDLRKTVHSPSLWEPQMGYARGVRIGPHVYVAGTVAADGRGQPCAVDVYEQTEYIIQKIEMTLHQLDASLADVVSTVTHLVDFADFDDYARAHKKYFGSVPPVNTTVQVASLVLPVYRVEITATALVKNGAFS